MGKIAALWALFRQGQSVADPKLWKERQITATALGGVLLAVVAVLKAFGVDIPLDTETAVAIGGGVIAVVNVILTTVTTEKIGFKSSSETYSNSEERQSFDPS